MSTREINSVDQTFSGHVKRHKKVIMTVMIKQQEETFLNWRVEGIPASAQRSIRLQVSIVNANNWLFNNQVKCRKLYITQRTVPLTFLFGGGTSFCRIVIFLAPSSAVHNFPTHPVRLSESRNW